MSSTSLTSEEMKKEKAVEEIVDAKIERAFRHMSCIQSDVDDAIRKATRTVRSLKVLLQSEAKKEVLSYNEVIRMPATWSGDPDTMFVGARKFRVQAEDSRFEVEKNKCEFIFSMWDQGEYSGRFTIRQKDMGKLIEFLSVAK